MVGKGRILFLILPNISFTFIKAMKTCTNCHTSKAESEFRVRIDKRIKNPSGCIYLNNQCLSCEAAASRERVKRERQTPEGRKKHNKYALQFHQKNRDKCIARMKERRQTPEYKAYMKAYRQKKREKIQEQERITKKRYSDKHRDAVTDEYVLQKLVEQGFGTKEELKNNKELIEIKRVKILTKRLKNIISKHKK
jgi:hypothetical protein